MPLVKIGYGSKNSIYIYNQRFKREIINLNDIELAARVLS